jgi:hypothetical protein
MRFTTKTDRVEFNPQKGLPGLMVERYRIGKQQSRQVMDLLGRTIL